MNSVALIAVSYSSESVRNSLVSAAKRKTLSEVSEILRVAGESADAHATLVVLTPAPHPVTSDAAHLANKEQCFDVSAEKKHQNWLVTIEIDLTREPAVLHVLVNSIAANTNAHDYATKDPALPVIVLLILPAIVAPILRPIFVAKLALVEQLARANLNVAVIIAHFSVTKDPARPALLVSSLMKPVFAETSLSKNFLVGLDYPAKSQDLSVLAPAVELYLVGIAVR